MKYLFISLGSLCEVEAQSYLALDIKYIQQDQLDEVLKESDQLKRMLLSFMKVVRAIKK